MLAWVLGVGNAYDQDSGADSKRLALARFIRANGWSCYPFTCARGPQRPPLEPLNARPSRPRATTAYQRVGSRFGPRQAGTPASIAGQRTAPQRTAPSATRVGPDLFVSFRPVRRDGDPCRDRGHQVQPSSRLSMSSDSVPPASPFLGALQSFLARLAAGHRAPTPRSPEARHIPDRELASGKPAKRLCSAGCANSGSCI